MNRLYDGTIFGRCDTLKGGGHRPLKKKLCFLAHLCQLKGYSGFTDLIKNQSIGAG